MLKTALPYCFRRSFDENLMCNKNTQKGLVKKRGMFFITWGLLDNLQTSRKFHFNKSIQLDAHYLSSIILIQSLTIAVFG
jgi:hypothetical protein